MINFKKHLKGFYYRTRSDTTLDVGYNSVVFSIKYDKAANIISIENQDSNTNHFSENDLTIALRGLLFFEVMLIPAKINIKINNNDELLEKFILAHHFTLGYTVKEKNISQFSKTFFMEYVK